MLYPSELKQVEETMSASEIPGSLLEESKISKRLATVVAFLGLVVAVYHMNILSGFLVLLVEQSNSNSNNSHSQLKTEIQTSTAVNRVCDNNVTGSKLYGCCRGSILLNGNSTTSDLKKFVVILNVSSNTSNEKIEEMFKSILDGMKDRIKFELWNHMNHSFPNDTVLLCEGTTKLPDEVAKTFSYAATTAVTNTLQVRDNNRDRNISEAVPDDRPSYFSSERNLWKYGPELIKHSNESIQALFFTISILSFTGDLALSVLLCLSVVQECDTSLVVWISLTCMKYTILNMLIVWIMIYSPDSHLSPNGYLAASLYIIHQLLCIIVANIYRKVGKEAWKYNRIPLQISRTSHAKSNSTTTLSGKDTPTTDKSKDKHDPAIVRDSGNKFSCMKKYCLGFPIRKKAQNRLLDILILQTHTNDGWKHDDEKEHSEEEKHGDDEQEAPKSFNCVLHSSNNSITMTKPIVNNNSYKKILRCGNVSHIL